MIRARSIALDVALVNIAYFNQREYLQEYPLQLDLLMKSALVVIPSVYVVFCFVLFVLQRKLLYFPQASDHTEGVTECCFENEGQKLHGWVVNEGNAKALIYYGGNAERIERNIDFFRALLPGHTVYMICYRGYGRSTGEPTAENFCKDALCIFDNIAGNHDTVFLMGRSLGSGIATYVAANRKIKKLILVTPYDSVENVAKETYRIFPVAILLRDKFESWRHARSVAAETLVLTAEHDEVISRARTENLIAQFDAGKLKTVVVTNAGHNDIQMYPEFSEGIRQMLNE